MSKGQYHVYALVKKGRAVYVGCSSDTNNRKSYHKKNKDFDKLIIIKSYKTRSEALNAENSIINFITLFGNGDWYNSENILLSYKRVFYLRDN